MRLPSAKLSLRELPGIIAICAIALLGGAWIVRAYGGGNDGRSGSLAQITVDYPLRRFNFPSRHHAAHFPVARRQRMAKHWVVEVSFAGHAKNIRMEVPGEPFKWGAVDPETGPTSDLLKLNRSAGGDRDMGAGRGDVGEDQARLGELARHGHLHWLRGRCPATTSLGRQRIDLDVVGSGRRANFLPGRAADAVAQVAEGRDSAAAAVRRSADQVEAARHFAAAEPGDHGEAGHLRQLPFVLHRRKDDGNGPGRPEERQGVVRHRPGGETNDDQQHRRGALEFVPGRSQCADFSVGQAVRLHVANLAEMAATSSLRLGLRDWATSTRTSCRSSRRALRTGCTA